MVRFSSFVQSIFYRTMNPQFSVLWMIDLLLKDLPGVGYPLFVAGMIILMLLLLALHFCWCYIIVWIVLFTILLVYIAFLVSFASTVIDWLHCATVSLPFLNFTACKFFCHMTHLLAVKLNANVLIYILGNVLHIFNNLTWLQKIMSPCWISTKHLNIGRSAILF